MSDEPQFGSAATLTDLSAWANRLRARRRPEAPAANGNGAATGRELVPAPAMDGLMDFAGRLVLDETLPFYIATIEGRLVRVNEAYASLSARCEEGSPSPGEARPGISVAPAHQAVLAEVESTGLPVVTDEWLRVDGRETCWRGRHFPVRDATGEIVAIAGSYLEVTAEMVSRREAMRARRRFSDFARATSDWFWETDRDGRLTLLSDRFAASVGTPVTAYFGRSIAELARGGDEAMGERIAQAIRDRTAFRNLPLEIRTAEGEMRRYHLSGVPVFDTSQGDFLGFRGAGMDITESHRESRRAALMQRNLEETLEELTRKNLELDIATAQAESALRAKNEFLAAMSHELRTPLNAIIGFAEAMEMNVFGELNEQYLSYCKDIKGAGRHLLSLINDVLDVAVLESDGVTIKAEPLSVRRLIEQASSLIRMRAAERDVDIGAVALESDVMVYADDRRTTQIFVNLLTNAVKFTPEGGRIGVELTVEGDRAGVTIWDTGIGISEEMQELVFEKFQQVAETVYSRKSEGTGLGLHISRELARLMGGDIVLSSRPGEGSRFTVLLPLADPAASGHSS